MTSSQMKITPASPSFLIGRDAAGRWVAQETHGWGGGYFKSQGDAMRYAQAETGRRPGAVLVSAAPITLRI